MGWHPRFLLITTLLLLAVGSSACSKRGLQATEVPPPATDDTTLGPADVFSVRVYGEEALTGSHQVAPDGTINFPLLGAVHERKGDFRVHVKFGTTLIGTSTVETGRNPSDHPSHSG